MIELVPPTPHASHSTWAAGVRSPVAVQCRGDMPPGPAFVRTLEVEKSVRNGLLPWFYCSNAATQALPSGLARKPAHSGALARLVGVKSRSNRVFSSRIVPTMAP